ncbi:MAG: alanine racemase [Lachnospiraceae bacterium]|nr:alanine racemase [Lachnospiraceae bacterium]
MSNYYRMRADIDLSAIQANIRTMKNCIPADKKLLAVIKANAYGHGAIEVANALEDMADYYGVAFIDEAVELRKAGVTKPILILGHTDESQFETLIAYSITQTIYTYEQAKVLSDVAMSMNQSGKIHVKIDTGMNRIGFPCVKDSVKDIVAITKLAGVEAEGIYTHYYNADALDKGLAIAQLERFTQMTRWLEEEGITFPIRHISNSAGIMEMPNATYDMVRSGIATYGLYPSDEVDCDAVKLIPAMELKCHITHVKVVKKGETVGYGGTYTLPEDKRIATVEVGYADGYPRALSNRGRMLVHGEYAPIVGRVCMDQTMIDVSHIPDVKVGDEVVLVGLQGDKRLYVEELAAMSESFNYEFVCDVNRRVPRIYYLNGERVGEKNYLV